MEYHGKKHKVFWINFVEHNAMMFTDRFDSVMLFELLKSNPAVILIERSEGGIVKQTYDKRHAEMMC